MRADNSHLIVSAARHRAAATRRKAASALRRMDATGVVITFETVAREAGVSRSWLYNQPDLRPRSNASGPGRDPSPQPDRFPTGNAPPRLPCSADWRPPPSATGSWRRRTASSGRPWPWHWANAARPMSAASAPPRSHQLPGRSARAGR